MAEKDVLLAHLVNKNREYLQAYNVTLGVNDLDFNNPESGTFEEPGNTRIVATMRGGRRVKGSSIYFYSRNDVQEAFAEIGYPEVAVAVEGEPNIAKVLSELQARYNFRINPNDVLNYTQVEDVVTFDVHEWNLVWTGSLSVNIVDGYGIPLSVAFPNNVLDGLIPPEFLA